MAGQARRIGASVGRRIREPSVHSVLLSPGVGESPLKCREHVGASLHWPVLSVESGPQDLEDRLPLRNAQEMYLLQRWGADLYVFGYADGSEGTSRKPRIHAGRSGVGSRDIRAS